MAAVDTSDLLYEEQITKLINRTKGREKREGYDCPPCLNREYIARVERGRHRPFPCQCVTIRNNIARLRRRGLLELSDWCTFQRFTTEQPWQKQMKTEVERYVNCGGSDWLFLAGQSGCGKTHLCTAAATQMILAGKDVQVFRWVEWAAKAKSLIGDPFAYGSAVQPLKECDVLFLDDFLKTPGGARPTQGNLILIPDKKCKALFIAP